MKKKLGLLAIILVVAVVGVILLQPRACSRKKQDVKKVGVILPSTGDLAFLGEFMGNSILLDSSDVTYIVEDCQGETKQAIMAANKLISKDKVSYIVTSLSYLSEAVNPVCENANIPHFILSFSPKLIEKNNVIQPFISTRLEAEKFVEYIIEKDYKKVAFLRHQEPDATYGFENIIKPKLEQHGVQIVDISFNNTTIKDFKPEILKVLQAEPDLMVIQSLAYNIPNIVSAMKSYNFAIPVLGDVNFLDIQDAQTMTLVDGIPFVGIESVLSENYKQYRDKYVAKYKKEPFALGSFAYDLGLYLKYIPAGASHEEILDILNKTEDQHLVNNQQVRFNESGQENVVCKILTFKDNKIVEY